MSTSTFHGGFSRKQLHVSNCIQGRYIGERGWNSFWKRQLHVYQLPFTGCSSNLDKMTWVPVCVQKFETMSKKLLVFKPLVGHKTCARHIVKVCPLCQGSFGAVQGGVSCSVWRVGRDCQQEMLWMSCWKWICYKKKSAQFRIDNHDKIRRYVGPTPPNPATVTTGNASKPLFATVTGCGTQEMQESLMYSPFLCQIDLYARTLLAVDVNSIYLWVGQVIYHFPQQRCCFEPSLFCLRKCVCLAPNWSQKFINFLQRCQRWFSWRQVDGVRRLQFGRAYLWNLT